MSEQDNSNGNGRKEAFPVFEDRKSAIVLKDGSRVYYTQLENVFCEEVSKIDVESPKELRKLAVSIYRKLRPNAGHKTSEVNARKLLKQDKILARIDLFRMVKGKNTTALLAEREEVHQKVLKIINKALDDEVERMKDEGFDPKASFLSGGRLMAVNAWLLEHQRAYNMHPSNKELVSGKGDQNIIFMTPNKELEAKFSKAAKHLEKLMKQGQSPGDEGTAQDIAEGEIID